MKIIIIGIQGSGKSTQGNLLASKLHISYLSTGHIFRLLAKEHTPIGRQVKVVMNAGLLISDEKTLQIVSDYLNRPEYKDGYILDGFPRTINQAASFENGIDHVIYLKISDKEALWRISGREGDNGDIREDETLLAVRKRIKLFHEFTEPVIEYYKKKKILVEINGEQPVEDIKKQIWKIVKGK